MFELEKASKNDASATEEKNCVKKMEAFEKEIEKKMLTFESKIKHFSEVVEEKDYKISELEKQLKEIKNKFEDLTKKEKTAKKKEFKCTHCDFSSNSEKGLKMHNTRMHTVANDFPKTCELCDYEIKNKSEMKKHLKCHTYKEVNFKCTECEFFCEKDLEIKVHIGNKHSEQFECGLCDSVNKDLESLNLHLTTCERYKCTCCDKFFANLTEVRSHIENKHLKDTKYLTIMHIKQTRVDNEVIDEKEHCAQEIFTELIRK